MFSWCCKYFTMCCKFFLCDVTVFPLGTVAIKWSSPEGLKKNSPGGFKKKRRSLIPHVYRVIISQAAINLLVIRRVYLQGKH